MARGPLGHILHQFQRLIATRQDGAPSDGQLLERFAAQHDENAFALLVQRHGPMVLNVCRRVLQDEHAGEDAFQAAFLVLVRRAGALDGRGSVASWLYTVAYHIALRARADAARRRAQESQVRPMPAAEPPPDADWQELRPLLDEELSRLPDKYRAPLVLCYLEGMTNEQAARELGWPTGSMAKRLARARQLLRARLTRRGLAVSLALLGPGLTEQTLAATLPASLATATVRAALLFATGEAAAGAISAPAVNLAEAALHTLGMARLRIAVGLLLLALGAAGAGAAMWLRPNHIEQPALNLAVSPGRALPTVKDTSQRLPGPPEEIAAPRALVEVVTAQQQRVLHKDAAAITALAYAPDGRTLASASGDKRPVVLLWDMPAGQIAQRLPAHTAEIRCLAFAPAGDRLASASRDKTAWIIDARDIRELFVLRGHGGSVYAVAFAADGRTIATGSSDKTARLWEDGQATATLSGHADGIMCLAFVPGSKTLATGSRDKTIKLWDGGTEQVTLRGHKDAVVALAVTANGKRLASAGASKDRTVKLWDLEGEPAERFTLEGHTGGVLAVAFSPDGRTLASAGEDGSIKLWDVATGKEWLTLTAHPGGAHALAFAADGKTLASGGKDGTIKLWDIQRRAE
jgi:RNA polymerase sigma factor (sigma-70 family)